MRASTVATLHRCYKTFWRWMLLEGIIEASAMVRIPVPRENRDALHIFEQEQFKAMMRAIEKHPQRKRNKAILYLLIDTGVRASEICALRLCDLDLHLNRARVYGKGDKYRYVYFGNRASRALRLYLRDHPHGKALLDHLSEADGYACNSKAHLFLCESGPHKDEPMTRSGTYRLVSKLGRQCGLMSVRCSPHTRLHTSATKFIRNEGNAQALQELLGHTDTRMTQKYVHISNADIRKEHRRASPLDRLGR